MERFSIWLSLLGLLFIFGFVLFNFSTTFCYDEPYYLSNLDIIAQYGLGRDFLVNLKGPAGPLFSYLHYFLAPITEVEEVRTRMVNVFLSIGIVYFIYQILKEIHPTKKYTAALFFVIPLTFPTVGMALTEVPAMFFFSLSLWLFTLVNKKLPESKGMAIILSIIAGLFLAIAILGRQPYLVTLGALISIFILKPNSWTWITFILYGLAALFLPALVFSIWEGLVPVPGGNVVRGKPIQIHFFFLALGYSAIIFAILSYKFFIPLSRNVLGALVVLFILAILGAYQFDFSFEPLRAVALRFLPGSMIKLYGHGMFALLVVLGGYFSYSSLVRLWENRTNFYYVTFMLMILAIDFSCLRISHQFSSRYIFQAAPLFLLIAAYHRESDDRIQQVLHIVGLILGILSLSFYC